MSLVGSCINMSLSSLPAKVFCSRVEASDTWDWFSAGGRRGMFCSWIQPSNASCRPGWCRSRLRRWAAVTLSKGLVLVLRFRATWSKDCSLSGSYTRKSIHIHLSITTLKLLFSHWPEVALLQGAVFVKGCRRAVWLQESCLQGSTAQLGHQLHSLTLQEQSQQSLKERVEQMMSIREVTSGWSIVDFLMADTNILKCRVANGLYKAVYMI